MKIVIRNLLPYGIVTRLAAKRQAIREVARIRERSAMLRQPSNRAVPLNGERLNMGCGTHQEPGWINADGADGAPHDPDIRVAGGVKVVPIATKR